MGLEGAECVLWRMENPNAPVTRHVAVPGAGGGGYGGGSAAGFAAVAGSSPVVGGGLAAGIGAEVWGEAGGSGRKVGWGGVGWGVRVESRTEGEWACGGSVLTGWKLHGEKGVRLRFCTSIVGFVTFAGGRFQRTVSCLVSHPCSPGTCGVVAYRAPTHGLAQNMRACFNM